MLLISHPRPPISHPFAGPAVHQGEEGPPGGLKHRHQQQAQGTRHRSSGVSGASCTWSIERAPASSGPYLGINAIREPFTVVILYRNRSLSQSSPSVSASNFPGGPLSFPLNCHSCSCKREKIRENPHKQCRTYLGALAAAARVISSLRRKFKRQHGRNKLKSVNLCAPSSCAID